MFVHSISVFGAYQICECLESHLCLNAVSDLLNYNHDYYFGCFRALARIKVH